MEHEMASYSFPVRRAEQKTKIEEDEESFTQRFVFTEEAPMQAAHRLLSLVTRGVSPKEVVPWRRLMEDHNFAIDGPTLALEASAAIERRIIRYVFGMRPTEIPQFLR